MLVKQLVLALPLSLSALPASAQVVLTNSVHREAMRTTTDGRATTELALATKMVPGTIAIYVMTCTNKGPRPATNLVINNHVPNGIAYVAVGTGSAEPQVSVDGGRTFGSIASRTVRLAGGAQRPATAADVTDVRWTIAGPLASGASASVSYKGRVK